MGIREELDEERRRVRRQGDPRITPEGRELLLRLTDGDLKDEFQAALDAVSASDPLLGGSDDFLVLNLDDAMRVLTTLEDARLALDEAGVDPGLRGQLTLVLQLIQRRLGLVEGGAAGDPEEPPVGPRDSSKPTPPGLSRDDRS